MAQTCSWISTLQMPHPCCVRFQQFRSCAASGSKTMSGSMVRSAGETMTIFLRATSSSILPMIQKQAQAKSARRAGPVTSVHMTETCEEDAPHLITHVATTVATTTDEAMTETIHAELSRASLTPRQHLIDTGYITAPILVSRKPQYGIEVIGPGRFDVKWQANTDQGIDSSQFRIDWDQQQAICPQGHTSISWTPVIDNRNNEVIKIGFSTTDRKPCPCLASCTHSASRAPRRLLTVRPQAQHQALQAARRRPQTPAFAKQYALRQGIEATISKARASLRHASLSLYRLGQNPFAADWYCSCYECRSYRSLARWR